MDAIFIWVPKTAGISFFEGLSFERKLKTLEDVKAVSSLSGRVSFGHMDVARLVESSAIDESFYKRAFKFAVCRDPYDRAVSLWAYLHRKKRVREFFKRRLINSEGCDGVLGLEEFFHWILNNGVESIGLHNYEGLSQCNPQIRWLEKLELDYLVRFERIHDGFVYVKERLGLESAQLPHLNTSRRHFAKESLTPHACELIRKIYAEDFEVLGYSH